MVQALAGAKSSGDIWERLAGLLSSVLQFGRRRANIQAREKVVQGQFVGSQEIHLTNPCPLWQNVFKECIVQSPALWIILWNLNLAFRQDHRRRQILLKVRSSPVWVCSLDRLVHLSCRRRLSNNDQNYISQKPCSAVSSVLKYLLENALNAQIDKHFYTVQSFLFHCCIKIYQPRVLKWRNMMLSVPVGLVEQAIHLES